MTPETITAIANMGAGLMAMILMAIIVIRFIGMIENVWIGKPSDTPEEKPETPQIEDSEPPAPRFGRQDV
jgi:hypothetical protein